MRPQTIRLSSARTNHRSDRQSATACSRTARRLRPAGTHYLDCEWILSDGRILVLEVDGSFHLRVDNRWQDMKRERAVVLSQSTVLRCASVELRLDPAAVIADLRQAGVRSSVPR